MRKTTTCVALLLACVGPAAGAADSAISMSVGRSLVTREAAVSQAIAVIGLPAETKATFVDSVTASSPARAEDSMSTAYVIGLHAGKTIWRVRFDSVVVDMPWVASGATLCSDITALLESESGLPILIISCRRDSGSDTGPVTYDTSQVVRAHEQWTALPEAQPALTLLDAFKGFAFEPPSQAQLVTATYVRLFCNRLEGEPAWLVHLQGLPGGPVDGHNYSTLFEAIDAQRILYNGNIPCDSGGYVRPSGRRH